MKNSEIWVHLQLNAPLFRLYTSEPADSECHIWTGSQNNCGYGLFRVHDTQTDTDRMMTPHRIALTQKLGRPITPGLSALHSCHNRLCVNPDHLSEGTQAEKMADMASAGRLSGPRRRDGVAKKQQNRQYQYTEAEITWLRSADLSEISSRLNVDRAHASRIRSRMRSGFSWLPYTPEPKV